MLVEVEGSHLRYAAATTPSRQDGRSPPKPGGVPPLKKKWGVLRKCGWVLKRKIARYARTNFDLPTYFKTVAPPLLRREAQIGIT